jgi:putative colanic acid biosynthesis UDP-glucose lipid carrier transferase
MTLTRSEHEIAVRTSATNVHISISEHAIIVAIFVLDIALIAAFTSATDFGQGDGALEPSADVIHPFPVVTASVWLLPLLLMWSGLYHGRNLLNLSAQVVTFLWIGLYYASLAMAAGLVSHVRPTSSLLLSSPLLFAPFAVMAHHVLWLLLLRVCTTVGYFARKRIVVLSVGALIDTHTRRAFERAGYRILREFALDSARSYECLQNALVFTLCSGADGLFLAGDYDKLVFSTLEQLRTSATPVFFFPTGSLATLLKGPFWGSDPTPLFELRRGALDDAQQLLKRVTDIVVAAAALLLLSPALALVAFAIRLESSGPIIFRQTRLGRNGVPFEIYKFRTMKVWEDGAHVRQACRDDARVTRVGRWLRKTSIDELPQLINVLRGDMSLVGPRPHALAHDRYYGECIPEYKVRQNVRPGITGWAQVNGHRGETPTVDKMAQRIALDLWYIDHLSESLDVEIMLRTLIHILRSRDAY